MAVYNSTNPSRPPVDFNRTDALSVTQNAAAGNVTVKSFWQDQPDISVADSLTKDYAAIQSASGTNQAVSAGKAYASDFLLAADYSGLNAGEARSALQSALKGAGLSDNEINDVLGSVIVSSIADDEKVDAAHFKELWEKPTNTRVNDNRYEKPDQQGEPRAQGLRP